MTVDATAASDNEPPAKDLSTKEGILAFCTEAVLPFLRDQYNERGSLDIETYLFATRGLEGEQLERVLPIIVPISPGLSKELYSHLIRMAIQKTESCGVIFTSETWILRAEGDSAMAARELHKYPNLGDHPDAEETLFISLEHVDIELPQIWTAFITRDAEGNPTLGPFETDVFPAGSFEGRFMNLLSKLKTSEPS